MASYRGFEILANVGGMLGLCFGGSLLTLCELIDFFIIKVYDRVQGHIRERSSRKLAVKA